MVIGLYHQLKHSHVLNISIRPIVLSQKSNFGHFEFMTFFGVTWS